MFNLFRKKEEGPKVIDKVWMTEEGKMNAIMAAIRNSPDITWICWFEETCQKIETHLKQYGTEEAQILMAREVATHHKAGKTLIFAEHYPVAEREKQLYGKLNLKEVTVWSALDEPMFVSFGGESIVTLMRKLGMSANEMIEHAMITRSIMNAQEKISKKITYEQSAHSQSEWFRKNLR